LRRGSERRLVRLRGDRSQLRRSHPLE
jgi:hypothetical protein